MKFICIILIFLVVGCGPTRITHPDPSVDAEKMAEDLTECTSSAVTYVNMHGGDKHDFSTGKVYHTACSCDSDGPNYTCSLSMNSCKADAYRERAQCMRKKGYNISGPLHGAYVKPLF